MSEFQELRPVAGYEAYYGVTSDGKVFSYQSQRWLTLFPTRCRYLRTDLCVNKKKRGFLVHRLVAVAWVPNPEGKPFVNHKNGDKTDNRSDNLEWVTASENTAHAWENRLCVATTAMRENCSRVGKMASKLSLEQRIEVGRLSDSGMTCRAIAELFNMSHSHISRIAKQFRAA